MLTRKQFELLRFIHERLKEAGVPPSFDEMKDALDLRSKSGIHRLITALEESNILGIGYGSKITDGSAIDELAVRVYVRAKLPTTMLSISSAFGFSSPFLPLVRGLGSSLPSTTARCGTTTRAPSVSAERSGGRVSR